jgi:hypothetical protein
VSRLLHHQRHAIIWVMLILTGSLIGCASLGRRPPEPFRVSEVVEQGDAARRASVRLVLEGLDADERGAVSRALGDYDRAIQVDPSNPYAFLAVARHHVDGTEPTQALPFLDKADALLRSQDGPSPRVEVHLIGLRGEVSYLTGDVDTGVRLLEQAREMAPQVWRDGHLSAAELR